MIFFVLESVWTDDVIKFKGEFYNIPASKIGPKSIQNPHPPIYLGGLSPNTFRRIVIYDAEGWVVTAERIHTANRRWYSMVSHSDNSNGYRKSKQRQR